MIFLVEERSRILHEDLAIPGTQLALHYSSSRVSGYGYRITVPASGAAVPAMLKRIEVEVKIAGRTLRQHLDPLPEQVAEVTWDSRDHLGRLVTRPTVARVSVGFVYDAVYSRARAVVDSFGQAGIGATAIRGRQEVIAWNRSEIIINRGALKADIAEGWTISVHHQLSPSYPGTLFKGDGGMVQNSSSIITTIAGTGVWGSSGDGGPGTQARVSPTDGIAVDAEGSVYFADSWNRLIRKVDPRGIITTVAGGGPTGPTDGIPATEDRLGQTYDVAVDAQGNIYLPDHYSVRMVDTEGIIHTVAGKKMSGFAGDGGPATEALFSMPVGVAVDSEGNLYIADCKTHRVRKVDTNGIVTTVAGSGPANGGSGSFRGDGGLATEARLNSPYDVAVDSEGNLYIADLGNGRVRKVDTSGIITTVAGGGTPGDALGDGGPAVEAQLMQPRRVAVDAAGNLYITEQNRRIRKVNPGGVITTVVGNGIYGYNGDGMVATEAELAGPYGVAVDVRGNLYLTDSHNYRVRKVSPPLVLLNNMAEGEIGFAEANGLGYILASSGRHLRTTDLATGTVLYEFGYDAEGNLVSITDRFGGETIIERDSNGKPLAITSPDGITTTLTIDGSNHLTGITCADGESYLFEYTDAGLLTARVEPEGNRFEHVFDEVGRVVDVTDEEGGRWSYSSSASADGDILTQVATAEGNLTSYLDHTDTTGAYSSIITAPTGAQTLFQQAADEMRITKSLACGMEFSFQYGTDSEYRFQYVREMKESTPSDLTRVTTRDKQYRDMDSDSVPDRITEAVTVNGKTTTLVTDTLQAEKSLTSPAGRTVTASYDAAALLTTTLTISGLHDVSYGYDARGRLTSVAAGSRESSFTYNEQGFLETITDPENRTTTYAYDAVGRMTGISRPDGSSLGFSYDRNGNMTMLTNPGSITHSFGYNKVNLNSSYETPLSGSYTYVYDRDRRLVQVNFPSGRQIINIYSNGRLEEMQTPEGNVDLSYSCGTRMDSVSKGAESISYGYDGSLVISETLSGTLNQALAYTYNNDFNLTGFSYAGGTVNYGYDNDGLLTGVGSFAIARNAGNGLPESITGGALNLSRTFNGYGEVDGEEFTVAGQGVASWSLARDNAGRITSKSETVDGVTYTYSYTYDPMGRLLTVTKDGTLVEEYQYDSVGTRIYEMNTLRGITARSFNYDDEDRLLTAGDAACQYDLDGYLTTKTAGAETTAYSYSSRGELLSVTLPDGRLIEYVHDPLGRRIAKKIDGVIIEKYLWQGLTRLLAVYDGADNLLMRFLYADGRLPVAVEKGGATCYLAYDQVGSLKVVADAAGTVIKRIDYDSFGNIIEDTNESFEIPFGFAGGLYDRDTGLIRFGFRDYDPDIGRWTAKDPIFFAGGDVDLYGYCLNDPVNWVDFVGLQQWNLISSYEMLHNGWKMHNDNKLSLRVGSSGTIFFNNFSWDTSNPSERKRSYQYLSYLGGAWHIILTTQDSNPSIIYNIGIGEYFGISFAENYFSFNLGFGLATPVSITTPCE
ncbi:MAG: hypothetical protein JRJ12_11595 [Deltaproteobacteria bacterium]|nr:hypothetical protein [Deltaproteobacteria bacterium]